MFLNLTDIMTCLWTVEVVRSFPTPHPRTCLF